MLAPSRETTEGTEFSAGSYGSDEDYDDEIDAAPPPIAAQTSDTVLEAADLVRLQEVEIHRLAELFAVPRTTSVTLAGAPGSASRLSAAGRNHAHASRIPAPA